MSSAILVLWLGISSTVCGLASAASVSSNYVYPPPVQAWSQLSLANGTASAAPVFGNGWLVTANTDGSLVGRNVNDFSGNGVWNYSSGSTAFTAIFNLPAAVGGFAAIAGVNILALTYDGNPLWMWNTDNNNATVDPFYELGMWTPIVNDDLQLVYLGTQSKSDDETPSLVYAINASTGVTQWSAFARGDCNTQMATDGKWLFVASYQDENALQAFNLLTGAVEWHVSLPHQVYTVTHDSGRLWLGGYDGGLFAYDAATGTAVQGLPSMRGSGVMLPILVTPSGIVLVVNGGWVNALHASTGRLAFFPAQVAQDVVQTYEFDGTSNTLYLGSYGVITKYDTATGKHATLFSNNNDFDYNCVGVKSFANGTMLAIGLGPFAIIDATNGKLHAADIDCQVVGAPVIIPAAAGPLGTEAVAFGNGFAVPGWPMPAMKLQYAPPPRSISWGTETPMEPMNPIISDDGSVAYSFDTNNMYAFDTRSGQFNWLWQYPYQDAMLTPPGMVLTQGVLVALTSMGIVFVNASTGMLANNNDTQFSFTGHHLAASKAGVVYVQGSRIVVINAVNFELITKVANDNDHPISCNVGPTPLNVVGGGSYALLQCNNVLILTSATMSDGLTHLWNLTVPIDLNGNGFTSTPILTADENIALLGSSSSVLYAVDVRNGTIKWKLSTVDPVYTGEVLPNCSVTAGRPCAIVATPVAMYAIDVESGSVMWSSRHLVNVSMEDLKSPLHVVGSSAVVVRAVEMTWAVSLATGALLWTATPTTTMAYDVNAAVVNNRYFFTGEDSYVIGYDTTNGNIVAKFDIQGEVSGVTLAGPNGCTLVMAQSATDQGDNEVIGIPLPEAICPAWSSL